MISLLRAQSKILLKVECFRVRIIVLHNEHHITLFVILADLMKSGGTERNIPLLIRFSDCALRIFYIYTYIFFLFIMLVIAFRQEIEFWVAKNNLVMSSTSTVCALLLSCKELLYHKLINI